MGYTVGDLRTSLGHGDVWIGVLVRCYTECNMASAYMLRLLNHWVLDFKLHGRMAEEGAEVQTTPDRTEMDKT